MGLIPTMHQTNLRYTLSSQIYTSKLLYNTAGRESPWSSASFKNDSYGEVLNLKQKKK